MTEEKEVAQEEVPVQQDQVEQQPIEQEATKEVVAEDADRNWNEVRQVLKTQKEQIAELQTQLAQKNQPIQAEEKDEFSDLDPDDYLTVDKAKRLAEKLAEKKATQAARQMVQEYVSQQNIQNDEQRMRSKHDDYDYIVENFAIPLIKSDPALAHKIQSSKNPAETAYRLGKLSEPYEEQSSKQVTNPKAEKILKNSSRPVSSNAVSSTLKGQADQFSKLSANQVWEMSQKYAKGGV